MSPPSSVASLVLAGAGRCWVFGSRWSGRPSGQGRSPPTTRRPVRPGQVTAYGTAGEHARAMVFGEGWVVRSFDRGRSTVIAAIEPPAFTRSTVAPVGAPSVGAGPHAPSLRRENDGGGSWVTRVTARLRPAPCAGRA